MYQQDENAVSKGSITNAVKMPAFTNDMDLTAMGTDGQPEFRALDFYISDNRCRDVYCLLLDNEEEHSRASHIVMYQEHGDPFKIFTAYGPEGYAKVPVIDLGFPVTAAAPPFEFQFRVYSAKQYLRDDAPGDMNSNMKVPRLLSSINDALDVKTTVTPPTLVLCRDVHALLAGRVGNIPDEDLTQENVNRLDALIRSFSQQGNKNVQNQVPINVALQQQINASQNPEEPGNESSTAGDSSIGEHDENNQNANDGGNTREENALAATAGRGDGTLGSRGRHVTNPLVNDDDNDDE